MTAIETRRLGVVADSLDTDLASMPGLAVAKPVWLGVDPGGRHTGIVACDGNDLLEVLVLHRDEGEHVTSYAQRVVDAVDTIWGQIHLQAAGGVITAIEDIVSITPHVGDKPINPMPLVDTCGVLVAVCISIPHTMLVRPAGHGSHPLGCYPAELVTDGERRKAGWQLRVGKSSDMRHARSAWDVIQAARLTHRANVAHAVQARSQPPGGGEAA